MARELARLTRQVLKRQSMLDYQTPKIYRSRCLVQLLFSTPSRRLEFRSGASYQRAAHVVHFAKRQSMWDLMFAGLRFSGRRDRGRRRRL